MAQAEGSFRGKVIRSWFTLAPREKVWLGVILVIALTGLTLRYVHQTSGDGVGYAPEGMEIDGP